MIALKRLQKAIAGTDTTGMQTGSCKVKLDYSDALRLVAEVEALEAQVEQLREMVYLAERYRVDGLQRSLGKLNKSIEEYDFGKTPAQCLAEVRAQAVEEFTKYIDDTGELSFDDISFLADESEKFSNQLRQQVKG